MGEAMAENNTKPPRSFWIIGGLALVWNALGLAAYIVQMTMGPDAMPADQREMHVDVPAWATAAYAIATNGGVIASLLLLFRSSWSVPAYLVSLAGVLVQMYHAFVIEKAIEVLGPGSAVFPAMIIAVAVALILYARRAKKAGWFR